MTHSPRAGIRVVGDVVNLAARLQSAAVAGEVVVNEVVAHLARPHVNLSAMPPLMLKGKAEPVSAFLVAGPAVPNTTMANLRAGGDQRLVDRGEERATLRAAFDRTIHEGRSRLVTVLGPAGIGKTRLVRETAAGWGVPVVYGACPSYGANGTYVPLVAVLDELVTKIPACAELARRHGLIGAVLAGLREALRPRRETRRPGPGVEEVLWLARELFAAAATGPLVVIWDSLEWAGPSLLRLLGDVLDSLRDRPVLTVCIGRPDLDLGWLRDRPEGVAVQVGALDLADSAELATCLVGASIGEVQPHVLGLVERVTLYGAGNPLYIQLLLESVTPGGSLDEVPATITAMVGAMIDRLPAPAAQLLGVASVIGLTFSVDQLALLREAPVNVHELAALSQRELIRAMGRPGEFGFVQQPVHEVAYGRLEKEQRYRWHRRLAEHGVSPAFHFESAVRLLGDLWPEDPDLAELSGAAAQGLLTEGTTALRQRDMPAAIGLLQRAFSIIHSGHQPWRAVAAIRLSDALMLTGDTHRAVEVMSEVMRTSDDRTLLRACLVQQQLLAVRLGRSEQLAVDRLVTEVTGEPFDRLAWCRFEQLRMLIHLGAGRFGAAESSAMVALVHARAIDDAYEEDRLLAALCEVRQWSPTPMAEKLSGCEELERRFAADRFLLVPVLAAKARCLALLGENDTARMTLDEAGAVVEQLRLTMGRVLIDQAAGLVCSLADDHGAAEHHFTAAADALEETGYAPVALPLRVQAAREHARGSAGVDEARTRIADLLARRGEMDVGGRLLCMSTAVRLEAGAGQDHPIRTDVLSLLDRTDDPCLQGEIYFDLAQAHRLLGRPAESSAMTAAAVECLSAVGATKPLRMVQAWM